MHLAKSIELGGQPVAGGKFPLVCAPLVGRTFDALMVELDVVLAKGPDILEWRVDFFDALGDTAAVIGAAQGIKAKSDGLPLLFTRRSVLEGGEKIALTEDQVIALYGDVCRSKSIDLIDYEMANSAGHLALVREAAKSHGIGLVLSFHDFSQTPSVDSLVQKFLTAHEMGADVAKVAVMPNQLEDVLALLSATLQASKALPIPLVSMSMGPYGSLTRLFGWTFGSAMTFAVGAKSSAPGQIPIEDFHVVQEILRKSIPASSPGSRIDQK